MRLKNFIKNKKIIICVIILCFCCKIFAAESTASLNNKQCTWYNLPDGLEAQKIPNSSDIVEKKEMRATVYGLYGDVGSSCTNRCRNNKWV